MTDFSFLGELHLRQEKLYSLCNRNKSFVKDHRI